MMIRESNFLFWATL